METSTSSTNLHPCRSFLQPGYNSSKSTEWLFVKLSTKKFYKQLSTHFNFASNWMKIMNNGCKYLYVFLLHLSRSSLIKCLLEQKVSWIKTAENNKMCLLVQYNFPINKHAKVIIWIYFETWEDIKRLERSEKSWLWLEHIHTGFISSFNIQLYQN